MKYVIEHLEEELFDWCFLEYKSMSEAVGKENLIITNLKKIEDREKLSEIAEVKEESVLELNYDNSCLLDMSAEKELSPENKFDYLVFGGILGDHPPQERTVKFLAKLKAEKRHLGEMQMTTDNAVLVSKLITEGKKLSEIKFIDNPSFEMEDGLKIVVVDCSAFFILLFLLLVVVVLLLLLLLFSFSSASSDVVTKCGAIK